MIFYLSLACFPLLAGWICNINFQDKPKDFDKKLFLFLCGTFLFLMIALRSKDVGSTDSFNYYNTWEKVRPLSFQEFTEFQDEGSMEKGFVLLIWLLSKVFYYPQFVFVCTGALFTFAICKFLYNNCDDLVLGFVMYITLGTYTFIVQGMRQACAMSICLLSVEFCKKRKFIPFLLLIVLAYQFHMTSFVFVVVYFIYGLKIDYKSLSAVGIGVVLLYIFKSKLIAFMNNLIDTEYGSTVKGGGFVAVAVYVIIVAVALVFSDEKLRNDKNYSFFFYLSVLGMVIYLLRYFGTQAAERVSFYFLPMQAIVLPAVIKNFDLKSRRLILLPVICLCILLFMYRLRGSDLLPYYFFWQGEN